MDTETNDPMVAQYGEMMLHGDDARAQIRLTPEEGLRQFRALHNVADDQPDDPTGHVFCFHGRYFIGDEHDHRDRDFTGWDEFEQHLIAEHRAAFIAPVYAYVHGAIRVKVGSFYGLLPQGHAEFDSRQVGFVFATRREMRKALGQPRGEIDKVRALRALVARVNLLDEYMNDPDRFDLD